VATEDLPAPPYLPPWLPRLWAFYLPQFHRTPQNDAWWGEGYTEWTCAAAAGPQFPGHYQPHEPGELGPYDLSDSEVLDSQAELARAHGVFGFVFYHYWFEGARLLEGPVNAMLRRGAPDMPFCLCWANENWTRRWDGMDQEVLQAQTYSQADDREHIRYLLGVMQDPRYFKIGGRPMLLVYRTEDLPDPAATAAQWREEAHRAGFEGLYLLRVESIAADIDPAAHGMDGAVEFAPDWRCCTRHVHLVGQEWVEAGGDPDRAEPGTVHNRVLLYDDVARAMRAKPEPAYRRHHGVFPAWDNTPRRLKTRGATIMHGATPESYQRFLVDALLREAHAAPPGERFVFVNAWNEWGEGCHLEPDRRWGRAYLQATRRALEEARGRLARGRVLALWRRLRRALGRG
jgi:lipopolysaccharide biosynthesis protein